VTDHSQNDRGSTPRRGGGYFLPPPLPDRFLGTPNLLCNGYRRLFHPGSGADHSPSSSAEVWITWSCVLGPRGQLRLACLTVTCPRGSLHSVPTRVFTLVCPFVRLSARYSLVCLAGYQTTRRAGASVQHR